MTNWAIADGEAVVEGTVQLSLREIVDRYNQANAELARLRPVVEAARVEADRIDKLILSMDPYWEAVPTQIALRNAVREAGLDK